MYMKEYPVEFGLSGNDLPLEKIQRALFLLKGT